MILVPPQEMFEKAFKWSDISAATTLPATLRWISRLEPLFIHLHLAIQSVQSHLLVTAAGLLNASSDINKTFTEREAANAFIHPYKKKGKKKGI